MNEVTINVKVKGAKQAQKETSSLVGALKGIGTGMAMGVGLGIFDSITSGFNNITSSAKNFISNSFDLSTSFEKQMLGVRAVLGATEDEFGSLNKLAKDLGASTVWSTNQVASGMEMLAKNGLTTTQIMSGAMDATLALASATGTDLSMAADVATDAMLQFGYEAKDMNRLINNITGVTVKSKFTIEDYAYALANVGGSAASLGVGFEEMNTTIATTSAYFSSGMTAGTAYRTFLTRLVPSSKEAAKAQKELGLQFFDASGNIKSMRDITSQLSDAFSNLTDEQKNNYATTLFGTEGMRFALGLAEQGVEKYDELAKSIGEVSAADQAAVRESGMPGLLLQLENGFESVQLSFGGMISEFINSSGVIDGISHAFEQTKLFFDGFGKSVSERTPEITAAFGRLWEKGGELAKQLGLVGKEATGSFANGEKAGDLFVDMLITGLDKAGDLVDYFIENKDEIKEMFNNAKDAASSFKGVMDGLMPTINNITGAISSIMKFNSSQKELGLLAHTPVGGLISMVRASGGMNGGYIKGFQTGGYVSGPKIGTGRDNILVRAEEGEVILNKRQQDSLMAQMDSSSGEITINNYFEDNVDVEQVASLLAFQLKGI